MEPAIVVCRDNTALTFNKMENFHKDSAIRITGCIESFKHFEPKNSILLPQPLHVYEIQVDNLSELYLLEQCIEDANRDFENHDRYAWEREQEKKTQGFKYKTDIIDGTVVKMVTFFKPRLDGDFLELDDDHEFLGRTAQFVCNLNRQEGGNYFLTPHIIEPALSAGELYRLNSEIEEDDVGIDMPAAYF